MSRSMDEDLEDIARRALLLKVRAEHVRQDTLWLCHCVRTTITKAEASQALWSLRRRFARERRLSDRGNGGLTTVQREP